MGKKVTGKNTQKAYKIENRVVKNRTRKLERHVKRFPEDAQAAAALKKGLTNRRKAPKNSVWTNQTKELAHLVRLVGGNGHTVIQRSSGKASDG